MILGALFFSHHHLIFLHNKKQFLNPGDKRLTKFAKSTKWILESHPQKSLILFSALANTRWVRRLWQYRLWSFNSGDTKLEIVLPKNQHFWQLATTSILNSQNSIISLGYVDFYAEIFLNNFVSPDLKLHNRYCHNVYLHCIAYLYTGVFFGWKRFLFMFLVLLLSKFQNWNNHLDASLYGI